MHLNVQFLVFNLRNILCISLVFILRSADTDITAYCSSDRGLPSPPIVPFLRSDAEPQWKAHLCDQLAATPVPSTWHIKSEHTFMVLVVAFLWIADPCAVSFTTNTWRPMTVPLTFVLIKGRFNTALVPAECIGDGKHNRKSKFYIYQRMHLFLSYTKIT